ncbi:hypothetical protein Cylst_3592 [Cylindrospermum stagnale PCC 7417]|uniref:Uncharacterized protein n=1 Tax=Cylindrospermum stagnale PCC 7417 TaxID=56107 RepID=K9WZU3_9NOST|nr:hypothetical protein [Cylindrospermum stagnale]AFZ25728.1 hypothetical protein Cylst_3592 [Cylindrospermum stagnale PCC 7417]
MTNYDAEIINSMVEHMRNFIEKPHPVFSDMPVCPFTQKARQQETIIYQVYSFSSIHDLNCDSHLIQLINNFNSSVNHEALLFIHPDKQAMTPDEIEKFVERLNEIISHTGLIAFAGHPHHDFNIQGVFTRQAPYLHFIVQSYQIIKTSSDLLLKTRYYENWTEENLKSVGFPRNAPTQN